MKTFFEWYSTQSQNAAANPLTFAPQVWEAATLAERERLEKVISVDYKFLKENYSELPGEVGQYYCGRLDSYDEVLDAIRNP